MPRTLLPLVLCSLVIPLAARGDDDLAAYAPFAAIDWVFDQMRTNDNIDLRRAAAGTLTQLPLYPARLKAIEEHLATEKDAKVAESLRAAVKKAKEADKK